MNNKRLPLDIQARYVAACLNFSERQMVAQTCRNLNNMITMAKEMDVFNRILTIEAGHECFFVSTKYGLLAKGRNNTGRLGLGENAAAWVLHLTPVPAMAKHQVVQISASVSSFASSCSLIDEHTIMRTATGQVFVCGTGLDGQLGLGPHTQNSPTPTRIQIGNDEDENKAIAITTGKSHTVIATEDGNLFTCGAAGPWLGLKDEPDNVYYPRLVENMRNHEDDDEDEVWDKVENKVTSVAAGDYHTVILTEKGRVFTCGQNEPGQLGIERLDDANVPTGINVPKDVIQVAAGRNHTAILLSDYRIMAFGDNANGQTGVVTNDPWVPDYPCHDLLSNTVKVKSVACGGDYTFVHIVKSDQPGESIVKLGAVGTLYNSCSKITQIAAGSTFFDTFLYTEQEEVLLITAANQSFCFLRV